MPVIRLPTPLRPLAEGAVEVTVDGATVGEAIMDLARRHPSIGHRVLVDGKVAGWVNVFVGRNDVASGKGLATAVTSEDTVTLVPAVAGG